MYRSTSSEAAFVAHKVHSAATTARHVSLDGKYVCIPLTLLRKPCARHLKNGHYSDA